MLEKINEYSAAIELTTLFILVMLSILIVTGWCMQPEKKYRKLLVRKRAGSTGGNKKKNRQLYRLRTLDQISETDLLQEYLKSKLFYIRDCTHYFKRNHLFTPGSRLETYYIPEICNAFMEYKTSLEFGKQEKIENAYALLENIITITYEKFKKEEVALQKLEEIRQAAQPGGSIYGGTAYMENIIKDYCDYLVAYENAVGVKTCVKSGRKKNNEPKQNQ